MRFNARRTFFIAFCLLVGLSLPTTVRAQITGVFAVSDARLAEAYNDLIDDIYDEVDDLIDIRDVGVCSPQEGEYIDSLYDRGEKMLAHLRALHAFALVSGDHWAAKNTARYIVMLDDALDELDYQDCETFGNPDWDFGGYAGFQVQSGASIGYLALDILGQKLEPYRSYDLRGTGSAVGIKGVIDLARLFRIVPPLGARAIWGRYALGYSNLSGEGYAQNVLTAATAVLLPGLGVGLFPNGLALNNIGNAAQIGDEAFSFNAQQRAFQSALGLTYLVGIWSVAPYLTAGYKTFDLDRFYSATFPVFLGAIAYQSLMTGRAWEFGGGAQLAWWCPLFGPELPSKFYVDAQGGVQWIDVRSTESFSVNLNNGAIADYQRVAIASSVVAPWLQLTLGAILYPVLDSRLRLFANYTVRVSDDQPVTVWPGGGALPRIDFRTAWTQTILLGLAYSLATRQTEL